MKLKKVKYLISPVFLFLILSLPLLSQAQTALVNPLGPDVTFEIAVKNVINGALGISGVLALIAFIYGGITWMISGGDSSKIQKGRGMMIWAIWGLVIIFGSFAILNYIFGALLAGSSGDSAIGSDTPITNP